MIVRRPCADDIEQIENIAANYDSPLVDRFEHAALAEENGKVKAFGVVRTILEIVLYCGGSDRDKVIAIKKLLQQAIDDGKNLGHDQLYVFVDEDFAEILIKKFNFRKSEGTALVLDIE